MICYFYLKSINWDLSIFKFSCLCLLWLYLHQRQLKKNANSILHKIFFPSQESISAIKNRCSHLKFQSCPPPAHPWEWRNFAWLDKYIFKNIEYIFIYFSIRSAFLEIFSIFFLYPVYIVASIPNYRMYPFKKAQRNTYFELKMNAKWK